MSIPSIPESTYPIRDGNTAELLVDGGPAFRRIAAAVAAARHRVWVTITFMWPSFQLPDGLGTALDVLDAAAARGVDVRLIFWRPDEETAAWRKNAFWGSDDHVAQLVARRSGVKIRWDRAQPGYCQHQKSWLIDTTAFVGGINLNPNSVTEPGHTGGEHQNHDLYLALTGPTVVDVHHNFAQRWNEASERLLHDGHWGTGSETDLAFPTAADVPAPSGTVRAQLQRTTHAGRYTDSTAAPGGVPFPIADGEKTILAQYHAALAAAQETIYIENQFVTVREILSGLGAALERGVAVTLLLPAAPDPSVATLFAHQPELHEAWRALAHFPHFTLAGLAGVCGERRVPVYVHSKLLLVDDTFASIGSSNLHHFSLHGNGELNLALWCTETIRRFRAALFDEFLGEDTRALGPRAALARFRTIAETNRTDTHWQGIAFTLDPASYGVV